VPDLDEAARKDVLEESSNEFERCELASVLVAGSKGHQVVIDVEDAVVGDGNPMGVKAEVAKERVRLLERGLGVDNPVFVVELALELGEGDRIEQAGHAGRSAWGDGELALVKEVHEAVEKLAAEEFAKHLHRQEVFLRRGAPGLVGLQNTAGNDAMEVRMEGEVSAPGVHDRGDAEYTAESCGIASELQESLAGRGEQ